MLMRFLRSIWRVFIVVVAAVFGAILGLIGMGLFASAITLNTALISMGIGALVLGGLTLLYPKPMEFILDMIGIAHDL